MSPSSRCSRSCQVLRNWRLEQPWWAVLLVPMAIALFSGLANWPEIACCQAPASNSDFGPVTNLSPIELEKAGPLFEALRQAHLDCTELSGVLTSRNSGYRLDLKQSPYDPEREDGMWALEAESLCRLAISGKDSRLHSLTVGFPEKKGRGDEGMVPASLLLSGIQSVKDGDLSFFSEKELADENEVQSFLEVIRSGELKPGFPWVGQSTALDASLAHEPFESGSSLAMQRFFPWTGADSAFEKPFTSLLELKDLVACHQGKWEGLDCYCVQARNQRGDYRFAWCPDCDHLLVFFEHINSRDSMFLGKRLEERGLSNRDKRFEVTGGLPGSGAIQGVLVSHFWTIADSQMIGSKQEFSWRNVERSGDLKALLPDMVFPEGFRVLH